VPLPDHGVKFTPTRTPENQALSTPTETVQTVERFEGLWVENNREGSSSGGMTTAAAEVLLRDGQAYFGIHGQSVDVIFVNAAGAGISGGSPFELSQGYRIIYKPDGSPVKYRRDGMTWWAGESVFTPDGGPDGGKIVTGYK
jgi:hypothetical protein